jgi:hypothetical protein
MKSCRGGKKPTAIQRIAVLASEEQGEERRGKARNSEENQELDGEMPFFLSKAMNSAGARLRIR